MFKPALIANCSVAALSGLNMFLGADRAPLVGPKIGRDIEHVQARICRLVEGR